MNTIKLSYYGDKFAFEHTEAEADELDFVEEQKMVTIQTFSKKS